MTNLGMSLYKVEKKLAQKTLLLPLPEIGASIPAAIFEPHNFNISISATANRVKNCVGESLSLSQWKKYLFCIVSKPNMIKIIGRLIAVGINKKNVLY